MKNVTHVTATIALALLVALSFNATQTMACSGYGAKATTAAEKTEGCGAKAADAPAKTGEKKVAARSD